MSEPVNRVHRSETYGCALRPRSPCSVGNTPENIVSFTPPGRPWPYAAMVAGVLGVSTLVTSGGPQEEAYLGHACMLRPETLAGGWTQLVPDRADLSRSGPTP